MQPRNLLIFATVALLGTLCAVSLSKRSSETKDAARTIVTPAVPALPEPPAMQEAAASEPAPTEAVSATTEKLVFGETTTNQPAPKSPAQPREPLHDPAAREALTLVGEDPEAEAYWVDAIFDPSLPAQEREDLMEDLNENGLSDPKHPGPEDLPLILNRLAMIEEIAPYGDEFMQEHLGEAYKDLGNMLAGKPVQ